MPRTRRKFGTKGLNHCIMRGINKRDIFFDDQDRKKYLKLLKQNKEKYKIKLGTYVLMQNHVHLIIQGEDENISKFFQSTLVSYSSYFNKKYERIGQLFQDRYKNKAIENNEYLCNVVRYVHYNPEKAGICKYYKYKWSGLKECFYKDSWLDKEIILSGYDENEKVALEKLKIQHNLELDKYEDEYDNYYTEFELIHRLSDEQVKKIIDKKCLKYVNQSNEKINDILLHMVIKEVIDIKGVSINQLSRVTGISRRMLNKIRENKLG